jgi:probable FeS assembly SUF system protein SufT
MYEKTVEVKRPVEATLIPSGAKVTLQVGASVMVMQALGHAYTVYVNGNLVRIAGRDGDALGLVILASDDVNTIAGSIEDKVWQQLKTCFDPEIPVNIVDLGLIYACRILPLKKKRVRVEIDMTLTAPACGMGPVLVHDVEEMVRHIKEVTDVQVALVFDPPWDRDKMSEAAKLQLGLL